MEPDSKFRLKIGKLEIGNPFLLGGLSGYAERVFRIKCIEMGAGAVVTPMMLDQAYLVNRKKARWQPRAEPGEKPVIAQVLPSTPRSAAEASLIMQEGGFDAVEINMACPTPKILRRGRGGALMNDISRAIGTAEAVRAALSIPVSAKIRSGFDSSAGSRRDFERLFEGLLSIPLDMVTVHARTVDQRYRGRADWSVLADAKKAAGEKTVAGSGDLFEAADAVRMLEETGVDAAAFGRGAISNPWIFREANALLAGGRASPDHAEILAFLSEYCRAMFEQGKKGNGLAYARKTCIKAARLLPEPKKARIAFCEASSPADFEGVISGILRSVAGFGNGVREEL